MNIDFIFIFSHQAKCNQNIDAAMHNFFLYLNVLPGSQPQVSQSQQIYSTLHIDVDIYLHVYGTETVSIILAEVGV